MNGLEWRVPTPNDVPRLAAFAPGEWRVALDAVLMEHIGRSYFHARVVSDGTGLLAVGHSIRTGRTGWLGNIVVRPDARNRGLGSQMTRELIDALQRQGCSSILLVATALGEPVYRRLGFSTTSEYVFLDVPPMAPPATAAIRRLDPEDTPRVAALDAAVTDETRVDLLAQFLPAGWVHTDPDGQVDGYFLPSCGAGLIVASGEAAGVELLRFKHALCKRTAVVPAANTAALTFLFERGARETARAPRMVMGQDVNWRPEGVFARAAGYCG